MHFRLERTRQAVFAFFINSFVCCIALLICVAAAEFMVRCLPAISGGKKWYDRPQFFYVPEDAQSMRGNLIADEKPPHTYRIGIVGDSFTFAPFMQYDDSFPSRLERMLNLNKAQRRVEVVNYGAPGYSSSHEISQLKHALKADPDLLILEITLNDPEVKPYAPEGMHVEKNEHGALVVQTPANKQNWLSDHSKLYQLVRSRLYGYSSGKSYEQYFRDLWEDPAGMNLFAKSISKMVELAKQKNVPLVAVVFPLFGTEIDDSYPFHAMHQKVATILSDLHVPYLDLEQYYRGIPGERLQVMPGEDFHPNEIGHRIAAEAIYVWLRDSKVIPSELVIRNIFRSRTKVPLDDAERLPDAETTAH